MADRVGNARIRSYVGRYRCDANDTGRTTVTPFGSWLAPIAWRYAPAYRSLLRPRLRSPRWRVAAVRRRTRILNMEPECAYRRSII